MVEKARILILLDTDAQPSAFDQVVAVDAGADRVFAYAGIKLDQVRSLVHGAIFTRGPKDLHKTAIFIGGSDVAAGEAILAEVRKHLLPNWGLQVSVMLDSNGANTTAAAAVRAAARHIDVASAPALVLGGTGPVGQRVARLLARQGADVRIASRQVARAEVVCEEIRCRVGGAQVSACGVNSANELQKSLDGRSLVIAAGAAGVVLLPSSSRLACRTLRVAIDLNAVPPVGIEGIEIGDKAKERDGAITYGAVGVGDAKMKIHKAAIVKLFERNDQIIDAEEAYELASFI